MQLLISPPRLISIIAAWLAISLVVGLGRAGEPPSQGHSERLDSLAYSPDGRMIATGSADNTAKLWDTDGRVLATLIGHTDQVGAVAFAPDGKILATGGRDDVIKLWDIDTALHRKTEPITLSGHTDDIAALAFSHDGKTLASASNDGTARLWDLAAAKTRLVLKGNDSWVRGLAFSPDGKLLATGGMDKVVILWDVATGRPRETFKKWHQGGVWSLAFSPDGSILASGGQDRAFFLFDVPQGILKEKRDVPGEATALAFNPDGTTLAVATSGSPYNNPEPGIIHLFNTSDWKERATLAGSLDAIHSIAFAPDGKTLASAGHDKVVRLWEPESATLKRTFPRSTTPGSEEYVAMYHLGPIRALTFSPDGKTLATASDDATIKLWEMATRIDRSILRGHGGKVRDVAYSPDGKMIASASEDGTARLWDSENGRELATFKGHSGPILAVAFSPDGKMLATGGEDATVKLWDVAGRADLATLARHTSAVVALAFSADGKTLASGSEDWSVKLWDVARRALTEGLEGHAQTVVDLAFSADGKTLASTSLDGTAILWDVEKGTERATLRGHRGAVNAVDFLPDGQTLITGGDDHVVKRWDAATGQMLTTFGMMSSEGILGLALSPDGRTLASGGPDRRVWIRDVATILTPTPFLGHTDRVVRLAYSHDGKTLASGGRDHFVKLWDAATGRERTTLEGHTGIVRALAFAPDGKTLASCSDGSDEDETGHPEAGEVILWDVATGKALSNPAPRAGGPRALAFSADGKTLAVGGKDQNVTLWDVASRTARHTIDPRAGRVDALAYSHDGKTLAAGNEDGSVILWTAGGERRATLRGHFRRVSDLAFSPDDKTLASGSDDRNVRLWDVAAGKSRAVLAWQPRAVRSIAFSPDGWSVAAAALGCRSITIWDAANAWRKAWVVMPDDRPDDTFDSVAFSPDGKTLVTGSYQVIKTFDATPGSKDFKPHQEPGPGSEVATLDGHFGPVLTALFTPDGKTLISSSEDGTVKLWDVDERRVRSTIGGAAYWADLPAISPDGETLATGIKPPSAALDNQKLLAQVKLWDIKSGRERGTLGGHQRAVLSLAFRPDGKTLATADLAPTVRLWDTTIFRERANFSTIEKADERFPFLMYSPDGKNLIAVSDQSKEKIAVFEANTLEKRALIEPPDGVGSVTFSPDGLWIATNAGQVFDNNGWRSGKVTLWGLDPIRPGAELKDQSSAVSRAVFSADGKTLATADRGLDVVLWDVATGEVRATFKGHGKYVHLLAYSPDGRRLASADLGNEIKLWDVERKRELATYTGHTDRVDWLAFSPDSTILASASHDDTIKLWDARPTPTRALRFEDKDRVELAGTLGFDTRGTFTAEMWVRWRPSRHDAQYLIGDEAWSTLSPEVPVPSACGWVLRTTSADNHRRALDCTLGAFENVEGAPKEVWFSVIGEPQPDSDRWQHLAVCKTAEKVVIYWNGKRHAERSCAGFAFTPSPTEIFLGPRKFAHWDRQLYGEIRSVRLSTSARYKADFTPDETFASDPDTYLLLDLSQGEGDQIPDLADKGHNGVIAGAKWVDTSR